jgi:hypothetical protein
MTTPTYQEMQSRCKALQYRILDALPDAALSLGDEPYAAWAEAYLDGARGDVSSSAAAAWLQMYPVPYALDRVTCAYVLARCAEAEAIARGWLDAHNMAWGRAVAVADEWLARAEGSLCALS